MASAESPFRRRSMPCIFVSTWADYVRDYTSPAITYHVVPHFSRKDVATFFNISRRNLERRYPLSIIMA